MIQLIAILCALSPDSARAASPEAAPALLEEARQEADPCPREGSRCREEEELQACGCEKGVERGSLFRCERGQDGKLIWSYFRSGPTC